MACNAHKSDGVVLPCTPYKNEAIIGTSNFFELESRAKSALLENGIVPPEHIDLDRLLYCATTDGPDKTAGRCKLHIDFPPTLWLCNHYRHEEEGMTVPLLSSEEQDGLGEEDRKRLHREIEEKRKQHAVETADQQARVAGEVRTYLQGLVPATDANAYLQRKGVHAVTGLYQDGHGCLVVPVYDPSGEIVSCQTIHPDGEKRFRSGGKISGGCFPIGAGNDGPLYIGEGLATMLSIHEATDAVCLACFSAGNLMAVAEQARARYPQRLLVITADNDTTRVNADGTVHRRAPEDNTGRTKGMAAASATGASLVVCPELDELSTDFNDLHQAKGIDAVRMALKGAATLKTGDAWDDLIAFEDSPLPRLDVDILPSILKDFVVGISENVEVPVELPAAMALATAAVACQRHIFVRVSDTYREPTNLYVCAALDPANRKSAVVSLCTASLNRWEKQQRDKLLPEIRKADSRRKTVLATIEAQRRKAASVEDSKKREAMQSLIEELEENIPEVPKLPRLLCDDVTPEEMAVLAFENDETISLITSEGGLFDTLAGRYSNMPNLDFVLKAYSGDAVKVDRKHSEPLWMDTPRLTLGLSPQPVSLQERMEAKLFRKRGFDGRFLYFLPPNILGMRRLEDKPMDLSAVNRFESRILWILDEVGTDVQLALSREAYAEWHDFALEVEQKLADGGEFAYMRDWGGKLAGKVLRISGIFHMMESGDPLAQNISRTTMQRACELGRFLSEHARSAYKLMGSDEAADNAVSVLEWIRRNEKSSFTEREAYQSCKGRLQFEHMDGIRSALKELEDRGYIRKTSTKVEGKRGRPKGTAYEVNPLVLQSI